MSRPYPYISCTQTGNKFQYKQEYYYYYYHCVCHKPASLSITTAIEI